MCLRGFWCVGRHCLTPVTCRRWTGVHTRVTGAPTDLFLLWKSSSLARGGGGVTVSAGCVCMEGRHGLQRPFLSSSSSHTLCDCSSTGEGPPPPAGLSSLRIKTCRWIWGKEMSSAAEHRLVAAVRQLGPTAHQTGPEERVLCVTRVWPRPRSWRRPCNCSTCNVMKTATQKVAPGSARCRVGNSWTQQDAQYLSIPKVCIRKWAFCHFTMRCSGGKGAWCSSLPEPPRNRSLNNDHHSAIIYIPGPREDTILSLLHLFNLHNASFEDSFGSMYVSCRYKMNWNNIGL